MYLFYALKKISSFLVCNINLNIKSCKNEKPTKSDSKNHGIIRINMITNESLEDLDVVRTHETKNLEEINFKTVMLKRIKKQN